MDAVILPTMIVLFGALVIGTPIALGVGIASTVGLLLMKGIPLSLLTQRMYMGVDSFSLLALPLFVMAGDIMYRGQIVRRLVDLANLLVGRLPGGLAQVNILASMLFAGISGSGLADIAAIGSTLIPAMKSEGYSSEYSVAVTAASCIVGPIIPPSLTFVVYSTITGDSIAGLFLAGAIPGILAGVMMMIMTHFSSVRLGYRGSKYRMEESVRILVRDASLALFTPIIIIGGILGGVFTATEAAGVAAAYALIICLTVTRRLKISDVGGICLGAAVTTGIVFLLIATTNVLTWLLAVQQVPQMILNLFLSFSSNPLVFLAIVNVFLLIVGTVVDTFPALFLTLPILRPVATGLGIDPLHFAVIVVLNLMIGGNTPPVGGFLFVACRLGNISMEKSLKPLFPFLLVQLGTLLLVTYLPFLSTFLPRLLGF
jgi:tripartite ATP-independent transporter DctM subunit